MFAFVLERHNEVPRWQEVTTPEPGPGQVRLRIKASGLCGTDLQVIDGRYPTPLPIIIGHEPAGVVDCVGPGVRDLEPGDRVGVSWTQAGCGRCRHCARRTPYYCDTPRTWIENGGAMAEAMIVEAAGCLRIPDALPWEEAAPLFCAGHTVMSTWRSCRPRSGDRVAVLGIGGLGHLAIQLAHAYGHEVIALTRSEDKRLEARALGADDALVVVGHAGEALAAAGGADIVLSASTSVRHNREVITGLLPEGRLGLMAMTGPMEIDPTELINRQLSIIGSMLSRLDDLSDMLELAATGQVRARLETYPLEMLPRAIERLRDGKVRYRAVMVGER